MRVTRKIEFDAGHRVMNHESKCANLHGHRYVIEITAESAKGLDDIGRVIDFSVLKEKLGTWIDTHWDHNVIIWDADKQTINGLNQIPRVKSPWISEWNPTAENMAEFLLNELCPKLFQGSFVSITKIRVWETPNCYAEVDL